MGAALGAADHSGSEIAVQQQRKARSGALCPGPLRFNVFKRELGEVTQAALTQALLRLEQNGIVPTLSSRCRPWPSRVSCD